MRVILRTSVIAALAALTIFTSGINANAGGWYHGGGWGGGYHGGGWHGGWHGGGWGPGLGVGLAFGLVGAAIASQACYVNQPVYDPYGRVIGYRSINTCY